MKFRIGLLTVLFPFAGVWFNQPAAQPNFAAVPGVVVAHSPAASGIYLGSPSIAILPGGDYVASHDFFGPSSSENVKATSRIFRSSDKGKHWKQVADIKGAFWSKLFVHRGVLYLIGKDKHYGNQVIRKSLDKGDTWTEPADSNSGLLFRGRYHGGAMPVLEYKDRLWWGAEDAGGANKEWGKRFGAMMISAPADADLLKAASWTKTNVLWFDSTYLNGNFNGWLEGNAVLGPNDTLWDVLRVDDRSSFDQKAALVRISHDGTTASFDTTNGFIPFPGGSTKFAILYDPKSRLYWTLANYIPEGEKAKAPDYPEKRWKRRSSMIRNTLALCSSPDLRHWNVNKIVLQSENMAKTGFQYVDWQMEGKDIIFLSRTAFDDGLGGADNSHNSNFITFHRVKNFRKNSRHILVSVKK